jgi:two-component system LytT family response regulator
MQNSYHFVINTIEPTVIKLPTSRGVINIDCNFVVRIEASSNYSRLFFANGKTLIVAKALRWFEQRINMQLFLRIHRTHLVNKNFINSYVNSHAVQVCMLNGERIQVAKRKRASVLGCLKVV